MKHSYREQLIVSFSIIVASIAVATGVLYYFSGDISSQVDKIISDKTLIARQTAAVGILAELKQAAPRADQYAAAIDKLLPAHDNLFNFLPWMQAIGQAHGVTVIVSFRGDTTPAAPPAPGSDGFSMSATGSPDNLGAFLKDIESQTQKFLLNIQSFDVRQNGGNYLMSIQGVVFSQ